MTKDTYSLFSQLSFLRIPQAGILLLSRPIFSHFFFKARHVSPSGCLSAEKESAVYPIQNFYKQFATFQNRRHQKRPSQTVKFLYLSGKPGFCVKSNMASKVATIFNDITGLQEDYLAYDLYHFVKFTFLSKKLVYTTALTSTFICFAKTSED